MYIDQSIPNRTKMELKSEFFLWCSSMVVREKRTKNNFLVKIPILRKSHFFKKRHFFGKLFEYQSPNGFSNLGYRWQEEGWGFKMGHPPPPSGAIYPSRGDVNVYQSRRLCPIRKDTLYTNLHHWKFYQQSRLAVKLMPRICGIYFDKTLLWKVFCDR